MSQVVGSSLRTEAPSARPILARQFREITNWTILGAVGGACAGWLALEIGLVFCFDLGWRGIHANVKEQVSAPMAIAIMRAGLGATFGLIAALLLGGVQAAVSRRFWFRGALMWPLVGISAGVLCWIAVEMIDQYLVRLHPTEHVVWTLVWAVIGGITGARVGAHWLRSHATSRPTS